MDDLSDYFQEQEERTADKLAELQTSLTHTNSKLDTLNATTAQLSTDHQQIQTSISDVECVDTEESSQLHQARSKSHTTSSTGYAPPSLAALAFAFAAAAAAALNSAVAGAAPSFLASTRTSTGGLQLATLSY